MKRLIPTTLKTCLPLCIALSASRIHAASLLLDFGATTVAPSEATLDMGHFAGAVPDSETSWNKIVNADATSGLIFSDGSTATGVSVIVGRSGAGINDTINFNLKGLSSSGLGSAENWGIYTNTSPTKDGIFATGSSGVDTNAVGIRVDGLAAGTYTLYISGRNTSTGFSAAQRFFAGSGATAASFSFSTNGTPFVDEVNSGTTPGSGSPNQADAITSTFAYGDNCAHLVVTLGAGDSLYLAGIGIAANEYRGFLNAVEIVPGSPVLTNFPATIGVQPAGVTGYAGSTLSINNVKYGGVPPLYYQWYFEDSPISGETNATLTLANIATNAAGHYSVMVSNMVATSTSSNALVTVIPQFNTAQMTNIWNLLPGDRFYITADNNNNYERGLAYDPITGDLLLVSQSPSNNIVILNATNGAEKYFMDLSGITGVGGAAINTVGVADDGAVYVANVTANATGNSYMINRWSDDDAGSVAELVYSGDPGFSGPAGLRWGDNIAVRGSGYDTQILTAPGANTNIVCLFTTDSSYSPYFVPNLITITNVPATNAFAQFGIAFGPGTNTFWAKTLNQQLFLVQYDLASGMGGVVYSASAETVPGGFRFISTDSNQKWMAGVMTVNSSLVDNVRLYDISAYTNGPVLADQELYSTTNHSHFLYGAGTGATIFGGNYVFALDSNNGIKAFLINTNLLPFNIISAIPQAGTKLALTWESVAGHTYQIQARTNLAAGSWSDVGSPVSASGDTTSVTNTISSPVQFYRIQGQ
jgi:hypothetical protein